MVRVTGEFITLREARQLYGGSDPTWRRRMTQMLDPLPYYKIGPGSFRTQRVLFRRHELEAWFERRRHQAQINVQAIVDDIADKVRGAAR